MDTDSRYSRLQHFLEALHQLPYDQRDSQHIMQVIADMLACERAILLKHDQDNALLNYYAASPPLNHRTIPYLSTFNVNSQSIMGQLLNGDVVHCASSGIDDVWHPLIASDEQHFILFIPIHIQATLTAVLVLSHQLGQGFRRDQVEALSLPMNLAFGMMFQLEDQKRHIKVIEREADILSQIDAELNDTIELNHVFTMMKDWALRFSNADAAALSLYDADKDTIRIMSDYGFKPGTIKDGDNLLHERGGITLRVARRGTAEVVPDVNLDPDYYALADGIRTQMSVPIKREDTVIGVLTLLSKTLNGFTDEHLEFVKRLSSRAGVAIDNARLFTETKREREKLSNIVRNIGDNVVVVDSEHRIEIINAATIQAFHLSTDQTYVGKNLADVLPLRQLQLAYQDAVEQNDTVSTELELPNGRIYYVTIEYHAGIGRIIVMQDIMHFKETDRLKTELVATVSHDLKQPLSVMRGYLDLLSMVNQFDNKSLKYIDNLNFAFRSMQRLIDDLLDVAHIEAGINLDIEDVSLTDVLDRTIRSNQPMADKKGIALRLDVPDPLPLIRGDPKRLEQIFTNLIGNGVKYTPEGGHVTVTTELKPSVIRIFIKDDGLGIGSEDQSQIFERFYRVRRPETDHIEGTGLGLAIVKSLVEAHEGKIDLKSALGEGSVFRVILPLNLG